MNRCKTCAHWGPEQYSPITVFKMCKSPCLQEESCGAEQDYLIYSYQEGGAFWPGPEFGCVHWVEVVK